MRNKTEKDTKKSGPAIARTPNCSKPIIKEQGTNVSLPNIIVSQVSNVALAAGGIARDYATRLVTKADSTLGFFGGVYIREIGCNINFIDVRYFLSSTSLGPPMQI